MEINYADIGKRIRQERNNRKITQEKLAEISGVTVQHISNIENFNTKLSLPVLVSIANAMEVDVSALLIDSLTNNSISSDYIVLQMLSECTSDERIVIINTLKALKDSLIAKRKEG